MSNSTKLVLFAIIPALIAGLFSIAPKLYDIATEPNAKLTYAVTRGPELEAGSEIRRITSIRLMNSGKRALHNVQASINLPSGRFESFRIQDLTGLNPVVHNQKNSISIKIDILHPREAMSVVAMALLSSPNTTEQVLLRSDEVLAEQEPEPESKKKSPDVIGAFLSGLSVFLMAILVASKKLPIFGPERADNIFYIVTRVGLTDISDKIKYANDRLTYLRTADILLDLGLHANAETREKCLKALKCLLLVGNIAPISRQTIVENIEKLSGSSYSSDEVNQIKKQATSRFRASNTRNKIDAFINDPTSFLKA